MAAHRLKIITADTMHGDILIHFSNDTAVQYSAQFLWDVRDEDGNVSIPESAAEADEPIILPE